jgi:TP901 family phage tail tape measure protein
MTSAFGSGSIAAVGLGFAIRGAVRDFEGLSDEQATMRSILATNNVDMAQYARVMESAASASRRFGYTQQEAAAGMNVLLETGVSTHEAMHFYHQGMRLARTANVDLGRSQRVLIDSMRQFNMQTDEGANFLTAAFTVAGRSASTTIEELQQAARYASVEMSAFGYQADEVIASLAGMSAIGLRGTTAGTRLRGMLAAMHRPTSTLINRVEELGGSFDDFNEILYDETGTLRPLVDATQRLAEWFQQFGSEAEQNEVAIRLFGRRALGAGAMMARLHERGADWVEISRDLTENTEELNERMEEAERERLRGFAHQMRQARASMSDFGRVFMESVMGPIGESETGFGDYLRNLALATMYTDESQMQNEETRQEYQALSPTVREAGERLRTFFDRIASGLHWLWEMTQAAARWIHENPEFVTGLGMLLVAIVSIIRVIPTLVMWWGTIVSVGRAVISFFQMAITTGATASAAAIGWMAAIIAFGLELARWGSWIVAHLAGLGGAIDEVDDRVDNFFGTWFTHFARFIPGIGAAIRLVGRLGVIIADLWRTWGNITGAREATQEMNREVRELNEENERLNEAAREYARRMTTGGREGWEREAVAAEVGFAGEAGRLEQRANLLEQIASEQVARQEEEQRIQEASEEMLGFTRATDNAGRSATRLADDLDEILGEPQGAEVGPVTPVRDAYVHRGGWIAASSGDVIVDRNSLAAAMPGGPGAMIPQLVAPQVVQQVGAMPQSMTPGGVGQQTIEAEFTIPVYVDGREIARAAGRHTFQVGERRGRTGAPGERRRVHAEGVG